MKLQRASILVFFVICVFVVFVCATGNKADGDVFICSVQIACVKSFSLIKLFISAAKFWRGLILTFIIYMYFSIFGLRMTS